MTSAPQTPTIRLQLAGELDIYRAAELKPVVLGPIGAGVTVHADLSRVTAIDTAGLQLLLLAKRAAQAAGGDFRLLDPSQPVTDALALLHLGPHFDDARDGSHHES